MAGKASTKAKKKIEKEFKTQVKKRPWIILVVLFLAAAAVGGFFVAQIMTKNDTFEIIGDKTVYLEVGETFEDEGAKVISFGRDISVNVASESTVNTEVAGEYYVKYTIKDIRFGKVCRYRYVIVLEVENEG